MTTLITQRQSYVAGRWVEGDDTVAVENPADESQVAEVSITPVAEFGRAVAEARRAFDDGPWALDARRRAGAGVA